MDPLSEILNLLRPRRAYTAGLAAAGSWSLRFGEFAGIKFNAVLTGSCWIEIEGGAGPLQLARGDCFLLTQGRPFVLSSAPDLPPADADPLYRKSRNGVAVCNGGGDFFLIGGRFDFERGSADELLAELPPIVVVRENSAEAPVLNWALQQLARELLEPEPGAHLVSDHLAHIMLVQVLRLYTGAATVSPGRLGALSHRQIGRAVAAMHANVGRQWTLAELAGEAGMSRSSFAQKFRQVAGMTPLDYVTRWRMAVAADLLRDGRQSTAEIAERVGYGSDSAFSTAFKRVMARSPREHRAGVARSGS